MPADLSFLSATADGVTLRLKVVPNASRTRVMGVLGDRLKVAVAAPPEGGRANDAVCALLAGVLGVPPREVSIAAGQSQPQKTATVAGMSHCAAAERLTKLLT